MHAYVRDLRAVFLKHPNQANAVSMKRYMRDQFDYIGLKSPELRTLMNAHIAAHGPPALADLDRILRELWALPEREFQYAATSLLGRFEDRLPASFVRTLAFLIVTKSWWDTVDTISTGALGVHFKRYPMVRDRALTKWRRSSNFWLRRSCILFQLNYKQDTDFDLLQDIIRENLGSKEFFINKAIGWALRQYSRVDPQGVRKFVRKTALNPLSAREALSRLEKRGI